MQLSGGTAKLLTASSQLKSGTALFAEKMKELYAGTTQLYSGSTELHSGIGALRDSSGKLVDGVKQLDDGAKQLEDGMNKFKQEAIDKIMHVYKDDIKVLFDRLSAVANASGEYNNFSGIADGTQGEVKFIFETEGITSKKEK